MLTQQFAFHVDWQTPVEDVPLAIAPFQGRVLVGVGKLLRIYDLGKKKLLRKCENKVRYCTVSLFDDTSIVIIIITINIIIITLFFQTLERNLKKTKQI